MGIVFVLFGETIVRAFSPDPEVIRYGSNALRIISAGFLLAKPLGLGPIGVFISVQRGAVSPRSVETDVSIELRLHGSGLRGALRGLIACPGAPRRLEA